jgi:tetratricopeptide (TPR) repeat protein
MIISSPQQSLIKQSRATAAEIESCQKKIMEIIDVIEQGGAEVVSGGSDTAEKIAHYYARMGDVYLEQRDMARAAACYNSALHLNPRQWSARMNLLKTRSYVTEDDSSKAFLQGMLAEQPQNVNLLNQLGKLHFKLYECTLALECFQQALAIEPENADSLYWMAGLQQTIGERAAAEENYARAARIKPLIKVPADRDVPDFSVLLVFAPFAGNTPTEYLMAKQSYEVNIFPLLPQVEPDIELLKRSGQIIINFVSDADQGYAVLPRVVELVDRLGLPVINHPAKIQRTTREGIAHLLQGIPDCRLARVVRHAAGEAATVEALQKKISFPFPLLARPAGTHGGDKFEKIESLAALEDFIRQEPEADHYLMEYVDYQSPDGHFRKYRFIFVDGQIMPYHLAIGNQWKVHHITTDMGENEWMQAEEKAFLENPEAVFAPKHYQALCAIQKIVDLDYFGIDCGVNSAGDLVIFEVNASMLVHQKNEAFPYKTPFVEKIKNAFDDMLKKRARGV